MQIQINNKTARLLGTCTGRKLAPGKNLLDLPEGEVQTILGNEQFKGWQKLAWVSVVQGKIEPAVPEVETEDFSGVLDDLSVDDAQIAISTCTDPELLAIWHERDKRRGIKKATEARIAELEAPEGGEG